MMDYDTDCDVLNLQETWMRSSFAVPAPFTRWKSTFSAAVRSGNVGRGSGGLLALVRDNYLFTVLDVYDLWIFLKLTVNNIKIIIGSIYFSPAKCIITCLELLQIVIDEIKSKEKDSHDIFLIGGDFNCRIGICDDAPREIFDSSSLYSDRRSNDTVTNRRGKNLLGFMIENGFVVLNGRSYSDYLAAITSSSKKGSSVVDLVWCDILGIGYVRDFKVTQDKVCSDHFPITVLFNFGTDDVDHVQKGSYNNNDKFLSRIRWDPSKSELFKDKVSDINLTDINFSAFSIDNANKFLIDTISLVAKECDMEKRINLNKKTAIYNK